MLYKPSYKYNKARSSFLLPSLAYALVIDCRNLSTPISSATSLVLAVPHLIHCTTKIYALYMLVCTVKPL